MVDHRHAQTAERQTQPKRPADQVGNKELTRIGHRAQAARGQSEKGKRKTHALQTIEIIHGGPSNFASWPAGTSARVA